MSPLGSPATGADFPSGAAGGAGLAALAAALRAKGGQIVSDAPLMGPVVEATGAAGLAELSDAFGVAVGAGQKGQAAILDADMGSLPQLFIGIIGRGQKGQIVPAQYW